MCGRVAGLGSSVLSRLCILPTLIGGVYSQPLPLSKTDFLLALGGLQATMWAPV